MELNTKRNKIILGSVILTMIFVIFIVSLSVSMSASSCSFIAELPEPSGFEPHKSASNRALVAFSGYLAYNFEDPSKNSSGKIFMPLELQSVGLISLFNEKKKGLSLNANCAKMDLDLTQGSDSTYVVDEIRVELVEPNRSVKVCKINSPQIEISVSNEAHYACYQRTSYDCYAYDIKRGEQDVLVKLIATKFEFEIDGDSQKIGRGKFSTPAKFCGQKPKTN